jgi:hypothetical protein
MLRLKILCVAAFLCCVTDAYSQRRVKQMDSDKDEEARRNEESASGEFWDKVLFGGSAGASFSTGASYFMLQPVAAYKVNENFLAGVGITYNYWSMDVQYGSYHIDYSDHAYGGNLFARHRIAGPVFAHAEYMPMNFTSWNYRNETKRIWSHALPLGGGLQQMTGRSGIYMLILYDVLWTAYDGSPGSGYARSYRPSPIDFRVGMFF